jgi:hypothetical protein
VVYAEYTLANKAPSLDAVTMPSGAAVAYTVQTPDGVDIVAAFYDVLLDQWSLPRQLTQDEHAESALSLACDGTQLVMAYLKTQTERNAVDVDIEGYIYHLEDVPQPGRTDLCVLRHTLGHDLAVKADSIVFENSNPAPGTQATIRATVENRGELIAENIECAFYDGDPDAGGSLIGSVQTVPGALIAGSSYELATTWDVPTFPMPHDIYVVVDPALVFDDRDRANNSTSAQAVLPDIAIDAAWNDQVAYTSVALVTRIVNAGVIPTGAFDVSWRLDSADGPEIGRRNVDSIAAGGAREVAFVWDTAGLWLGEWVEVYVVADDLAAVNEFDEGNNTHVQSLMPHAPCVCGDLNSSGFVDLDDFATFAACFALSFPTLDCDAVEFTCSDMTGNGRVDLDDFATFAVMYATVPTTTVPNCVP